MRSTRLRGILLMMCSGLWRGFPGYVLLPTRVRVISQLILDEYLEPRGLSEITFRQVVAETRAQCRGFYSGDIARLVAAELVTEGIKVWR